MRRRKSMGGGGGGGEEGGGGRGGGRVGGWVRGKGVGVGERWRRDTCQNVLRAVMGT
jgi:hypothetical protein